MRDAATRTIGFLVLLLGITPGADAAEDFEAFEKDIRPLLVESCLKCHGADKQKGGLRVDSREALVEGGGTGPALVPGNPGESLLIEAVKHTDDLKMPPDRKLGDEQVAALERWVAAGAPWPKDKAPGSSKSEDARRTHWSFRPIADPAPPPVADPAWVRTPVDAFVLARLTAAGLKPSPRADRATLIRRVTYDLTGLPPTLEEVDAFVNDPDPDAFTRVVDRLLASEAYGEHWARHWLDVARYSDTKGYVYGREERFLVQAPTYRDWVVKALNDDMPYNRFLLDQIAADQAEPENPSALAGMGFLTIGRRFLGVTHDIIDDRIDVVTRGTMGMTVACARCHDHKYDPIPTADYYSLYGIFNNSRERLLPAAGSAPPTDATKSFNEGLATRREALRKGMQEARDETSRRVRARLADYLMAQREIEKLPQEDFSIILAPADFVPAFARRWAAYLAAAALADDPIFRPWRRFIALRDDEFAAKAADVTASLGDPDLNPLVAFAFATPPASMKEVADRYAKLFADVEARWKAQADPAKPPLPDPDGEALRQVLYGDHAPCVVPDEQVVSIEWFFDTGTVSKLWGLQGEVDRYLIQTPGATPHAVAMVDRDELREPRIFRRGNPANRGDEVSRRFLYALGGPDRKPFTTGSGRLELARAIVDPANPLTPRVWVNRVWLHHFGAGLVRTPSDFGLRSEKPSHPELLDWLARRLMAEDWSTKTLHRLILLSSTYQQSSEPLADPKAEEVAVQADPENRLLWRMNPHRLTFEETRDTLLAVTGELDRKVGGRGTDLFGAALNTRRTLYGMVDRQFLPAVLRMFDFASPDLHIPTRSETTVPQQALFVMNHPFLAGRARVLAAGRSMGDVDGGIRGLYRAIYQREPTPHQLKAARAFLDAALSEPPPEPPAETRVWSYGYGAIDTAAGRVGSFQPMPHFNGSAWGGGPQWPDPALGWVRITATGGHPGGDLQHATIRRWTSPLSGVVSVRSTATHEPAVGNGIRCWVISSRHGVLKTVEVHTAKVAIDVDGIAVEPGDTLDFVVDFHGELNSDQHLWAPKVLGPAPATAEASQPTWDATRDFTGPVSTQLEPWAQLAQVLLMANELMFVD